MAESSDSIDMGLACEIAQEAVLDYCESRNVPTHTRYPWSANQIGCGHRPLTLILCALIEDNKRLRDELEQFKMDMGT